MVSSLTKAFTSINAERTSSAAALTSSSNKIEPGVALFQTTFSSSNWSGDLKAYAFNQSTQKPEGVTWEYGKYCTLAPEKPFPDAGYSPYGFSKLTKMGMQY